MERILTSKEREQLIKRHKKERDGRIRDRIKVVLAFDDGYAPRDISKILLLDDKTVRRHLDDYWQQQKLKPVNGGSKSKLSDSEKSRLIEHLQAITYLYVKDICVYVKEVFGKQYTVSGMTKWLQANHFRYKKPHGVPAKADTKRQKAFIEYYKDLKEKTENKEPIYFADSVHPQHQTHLAYGWIYKGVRKQIAMTGRQKRLNFIGGICLDGHKIVTEKVDKVDGNSIILFLKKLRQKHPNKKQTIHLIWDNAGYHRSKDVTDYAKAHLSNVNYFVR
jgi:transposase